MDNLKKRATMYVNSANNDGGTHNNFLVRMPEYFREFFNKKCKIHVNYITLNQMNPTDGLALVVTNLVEENSYSTPTKNVVGILTSVLSSAELNTSRVPDQTEYIIANLSGVMEIRVTRADCQTLDTNIVNSWQMQLTIELI